MLMRIFLPVALLVIAQIHVWAQRPEADYTIEVSLNSSTHRLSGIQRIEYRPNSSDTLNELFFHLYFNAFQPNSSMAERTAALPDPDGRMKGRFETLSPSEQGWSKLDRVLVNGRPQRIEVRETTAKIFLDRPILPGESVAIETKFEAQVPVQIRRTGRDNKEGVDYTMTQWYPKLAQRDRYGWKTLPYVNREFFGIFGTFDVRIKTDANMILAGTGVLVNACSIESRLSQAHCSEAQRLKTTKTDLVEWHFKAENVHDFAWAADRDFRIDRNQSAGGVDLFFARAKKSDGRTWNALQSYTIRFFDAMDTLIGPYPYPRFSVIQGGDGGMEYPMCTMVLGASEPDQIEGFVGLMVHEAAHNWFYGVIATDEQRYPWVDEGFTSYAESVVMSELFPSDRLHPHVDALQAYRNRISSKSTEPLSTPADFYTTNRAYGVGAYVQGELFLWQLEGMVGTRVMRESLRAFFREYAFAHPEPADLIRILERRSGMQLQWFSDLWIGTTQTVDHGIASVRATGRDQIEISLYRKGGIPMPVDVELNFKDGSRRTVHIPLDWCFGSRVRGNEAAPEWKGYAPKYQTVLRAEYAQLKSVRLDPGQQTADIDLSNNDWVAP